MISFSMDMATARAGFVGSFLREVMTAWVFAALLLDCALCMCCCILWCRANLPPLPFVLFFSFLMAINGRRRWWQSWEGGKRAAEAQAFL
jgi:hypothetical protein